MSVRNAGKTIREARLNAGLSQEKLSEGICSALSLSRIENGAAGVSPSTFQALMAHAGAPCEIFPIFANRKDFDCFYGLKHARFYLNAWQLQTAYEELNKVEEMIWAGNKFYYQEWVLLHCKLQFRSGLADHQQNYELLLDAIHITRSAIDFTDFRDLLLSLNEIELLILFAQENLYLNQTQNCLSICMQVESYLNNSEITFLEKEQLLAELSIAYSKYLIFQGSYQNAKKILDKNRNQMVLYHKDCFLLELQFLTGLVSYHQKDTENATTNFQNSFYAAHAIKSCYATTIRNYIRNHLSVNLSEYLFSLPDIELKKYPTKKIIDTTTMSDGTYGLFSPEVLTIGKLISKFRIERNVSQSVLCQGLCSKSKLSKIENEFLQPDVFLTEALFQRLGLSADELTFWGNDSEYHIYNLRIRLIHNRNSTIKENNDLLAEYNASIPQQNNILKQFYLFHLSSIEPDNAKAFSLLNEALSLTLDNFDIHQIHNYRLSWNELTILNNIGYRYRNTETSNLGILYLNKILEYQQLTAPDILLQNHIFPLTKSMLCRSLYLRNQYVEIIDLFSADVYPIPYYRFSFYGSFLFFYCQSLGECSHYSQARLFGNYSCSLENLVERQQNSNALKQYLLKDFGIQLD